MKSKANKEKNFLFLFPKKGYKILMAISVAKNTNLYTLSAQEEQFRILFKEYFASMCLFAARFLSDPELAKDAVHDVFINVWESSAQLNHLENEKGYLYTMVRNHCLDILRKQKVQKKFSESNDWTDKESDDYLEIEMMREETYRLLEQAISRLPERSREILQLKLAGYKNQDIAEKLNLSVNTVNTLKKNSYKLLRNILQDKFLICWILFFKD